MRKHTPMVLSFVLLLFLAVLGYNIISLQANMNFRVNENEDEILAARVLNCTKIYVNKPVNLTTIINNPTTWVLKNITFSISLPLKTRIIMILNNSLVNTSIEETDEEIIVSVNITQINSQSIFVHWLIIQFEEKGDYEIGGSDIEIIKQKGELTEKETIKCPAIKIHVYEQEREIPPEGERDATLEIILVMVALPLFSLVIADKIALRRQS